MEAILYATITKARKPDAKTQCRSNKITGTASFIFVNVEGEKENEI